MILLKPSHIQIPIITFPFIQMKSYSLFSYFSEFPSYLSMPHSLCCSYNEPIGCHSTCQASLTSGTCTCCSFCLEYFPQRTMWLSLSLPLNLKSAVTFSMRYFIIYLFEITFYIPFLALSSVFSTYHFLIYVFYLFILFIMYLPYSSVSSMRVDLFF